MVILLLPIHLKEIMVEIIIALLHILLAVVAALGQLEFLVLGIILETVETEQLQLLVELQLLTLVAAAVV
jgi:hypothetical protein